MIRRRTVAAELGDGLGEAVGGIVVATGYDLYTVAKQGPYPERLGYGEYGYGTH